MTRWQERTALVTGAGSGIGAAAARLIASNGARVLVTDVDPDAARAVAKEIGAHARHLRLDVADEDEWRAAVAAGLEWSGRLDMLVANAGIAAATPLIETPLEQWRQVLAVNLDGVFLGLKHAGRVMRDGAGGSAVVVSSASGIKAAAGAAAYCASKAGAILLAKTAAMEWSKDEPYVRVNVVAPAAVRTPLWRQQKTFRADLERLGDEAAVWREWGRASPLGRVAEPEDVARAIVYLLSEEASYITGAVLPVDGGYAA